MKILIAILLLSSPLFATAEISSSYSKEHSECVKKSDGGDFSLIDCNTSEWIKQDKRLNTTYKKLLTQLKGKRKNDLKEAQKLWLKYTNANCTFYYDPDGGTLARLEASSCDLEATVLRANELESYSERFN